MKTIDSDKKLCIKLLTIFVSIYEFSAALSDAINGEAVVPGYDELLDIVFGMLELPKDDATRDYLLTSVFDLICDGESPIRIYSYLIKQKQKNDMYEKAHVRKISIVGDAKPSRAQATEEQKP